MYSLRHEENAHWMNKYMREQYPFIGIKKPQRHQLLKEWYAHEGKGLDWFQVSNELFRLKEREFQYIALDYLLFEKKNWDERIPQLVEDWIGEQSWWDVVDVLGPHVMGIYIMKHPEQRDYWIQWWMASGNFWLQRVCLLFQLTYKQKTDLNLLGILIQDLSKEKEFFIQKAIGWSLRQYARVDGFWVKDFVLSHELAPLSRREALKHL
ncbi:DNA alkylation repair protein [Aquirufa aurantiipilula]|uniref:DNA alkylation repair protein n=1 Tax=Aquirufa aurantiipilula TaxID=2696561 RepID=A0ABT6BH64_9BACT|nr:DNA alkylation repair protein [Aquirufa aurantiipilula]MDF5689520.1 DNA alkylation repair protein [Aquirufa aurantiipilula]